MSTYAYRFRRCPVIIQTGRSHTKYYQGEPKMKSIQLKGRRKALIIAAVCLAANLAAVIGLGFRERSYLDETMSSYVQDSRLKFNRVMDNYKRSFQVFEQMITREIERNPEPDDVLSYLKSIDSRLAEIEGETFDGLYLYYRGRYLYSWDTPYSVYEESGYQATERPWYLDAAAGNGDIVFTPPYMSYANHYILTTISRMQPDGETVFAYDIKMGEIQNLVSSMNYENGSQLLIFDRNGTIIGSTDADYLGGSLTGTKEAAALVLSEAEAELAQTDAANTKERSKTEDKIKSAAAFYQFRQNIDSGLETVLSSKGESVMIKIDGSRYLAKLLKDDNFSFLILLPEMSALGNTLTVWLLPLLLLELLLVYLVGRITKEQKNRELREAYVELGQTQKRLEIALSAAQKAAAVDELTGIMNHRAFRKALGEALETMEPDESGILIMIDGDHFKQINDKYGHNIGDEVIKLTAQMIVGRIRTIDLASRLHGDEFAIFVSNTDDYTVARKIMEDINRALEKEAKKRNMPAITLSAGAVKASNGDSITALSKTADAALYRAKETHHGGFAC